MSDVTAKENIPLSRPMFGAEEEQAVVECMRSGWVSSGPRVQAFEKAFAERVGCADAVATSSGTAALHLALWSLDLQPGDEVITPALTWVSVPNLTHLLGARPVFCDVDPRTLCLDLNDAERRVTKRTRAIVPVHFAGRTMDMEALAAFAAAHRLIVIEDAAHAIGAAAGNRPIGCHSPLVAFSFHPNKNISTGEGGMLTGHDGERLARARSLRYHGVTRDTYNRIGTGQLPHYTTVKPGVKYIMTDIAASIGLCQMAKLEVFNAARARLAARYRERLRPFANRLWVPEGDEKQGNSHVWHLFNVCVEDRADLRDRVMQALLDEGIGVGLHYRPVHEMPWVAEEGLHRNLPHTERIGRTIISLPLYPGMTEAQVDRVSETLARAVERLH